jgi:AraC-like DNA-binding protein
MAPFRLRRVRDHVAASFATRVTNDSMAQAAGLSLWHFCRAFRRATGLTPMGYLREYRLGVAARLLAHTDLPVMQVAAATGFASHAHFTTTFLRAHGLTPRRWRRAQLDGSAAACEDATTPVA